MTKLLSFVSSLEQDLVHLHTVHGGPFDVELTQVVLHNPNLPGVSRPTLDLYQVKMVHPTSQGFHFRFLDGGGTVPTMKHHMLL